MSFLNCYIWSVFADDCVPTDHYLVHEVFKYDSNTPEFNRPINAICVMVPEFEIMNRHLLDGLDYELINQYKIPIIEKVTKDSSETWTIDLTYYNDQINSMQSNNS